MFRACPHEHLLCTGVMWRPPRRGRRRHRHYLLHYHRLEEICLPWRYCFPDQSNGHARSRGPWPLTWYLAGGHLWCHQIRRLLERLVRVTRAGNPLVWLRCPGNACGGVFRPRSRQAAWCFPWRGPAGPLIDESIADWSRGRALECCDWMTSVVLSL